jgi:hypothetical protein
LSFSALDFVAPAALRALESCSPAYHAAPSRRLDRFGPSVTPQALETFATHARKRMRTEGGGYRHDHLRALAPRVEIDAKEARIMGSKSVLLRTLVAVSSAKTAGFGVPSLYRGGAP